MVRDSPPRRAVLASLGVGVAATGLGVPMARRAAASTQDQRVISVNSAADVPVEYEFEVSGTVEKSGHVPPGLPHDEATQDPDDEVDGGSVEGFTQGGVDSYRFTGEVTSFSATNCGEANVWVDDERIDACSFPGDDGSETSVVSINSPADEQVRYAFEAAESVEKSSAVPEELPHDEASRDPDDEIDGTTVRGLTQGGVDSYEYDELVAFAVESGNCEAANVWIDGDRVDACALQASTPAPGEGSDATEVTGDTTIDEAGSYVLAGEETVSGVDVGIDVQADDVTLDGRSYCLDGDGNQDGVGIRIAGDDVTVRNVCVEGWGTCVEVTGDAAALLESTLTNAGLPDGTGLRVDGAAGTQVAATEVSASTVGVALDGSSGGTYRDNAVGTAGSNGLSVVEASGAAFVDNAVSGITAGAGVRQSVDLTFRGNVLEGGEEDGITVTRSSDVRLEANDAEGGGSGISLFESSDCAVTGNTATDSDDSGISLYGSDDNVVSGNEVRDNGSLFGDGGIVLTDADDNEVTGNTVCGNGGPSQIVVDGDSEDNEVSDNDTC